MTDKPKKRRGRPPRPEAEVKVLKDEICNLLVDGIGGKVCSTHRACQKFGIGFSTFFRWLENDIEFRNQYARAKELQAEAWFGEGIIDICDEQPELIIDDAGAARIDSAFVQHQRMRIDARKWLASKLMPKKYGDKITQEVTGKDGAPLNPSTSSIDFTKLSSETLKEIMNAQKDDSDR